MIFFKYLLSVTVSPRSSEHEIDSLIRVIVSGKWRKAACSKDRDAYWLLLWALWKLLNLWHRNELLWKNTKYNKLSMFKWVLKMFMAYEKKRHKKISKRQWNSNPVRMQTKGLAFVRETLRPCPIWAHPLAELWPFTYHVVHIAVAGKGCLHQICS